MRLSSTYIRPVLTALLFPIVLLGAMWALDEFTGDEWLPWTHVKLTSRDAVQLAQRECFASYPESSHFGPWHTKLRGTRWRVYGTRSGLPWLPISDGDAVVYALIDAESGTVIDCRMI
jgi:hypothetical protein